MYAPFLDLSALSTIIFKRYPFAVVSNLYLTSNIYTEFGNDVAVFVKGVVGDVIEGVASAGIVAEIVGQFGFLSDIIPRFIRVHAHCLDACHAESAVVIVFEIFEIHLCVLFKNFFARTVERRSIRC